MQDVSVKFSREGQGWVSLALSVGDDSFVLPWLSHTTDVFGDLLRSAVHIAAGGYIAEARFDREPHEFRLLLERRWEAELDRETFGIRVLEFADIYAKSPESEGHQVFCASCEPLDFARAVHIAVRQVREEADDKGNLDWWRLPFPFRAFGALEAAIAEDR